jgi:AP-2 complex subunit mu-1
LKVIANFSDKLFATHVVIKIPVPENTVKAKIKTSLGRAKYEPEQQAIMWRVKCFPGKAERMLTADIDLIWPKAWNNRPPIDVEFQVPMLTASGVHVRFLRVYDKSGYHTTRWLRYTTKAGAGGYQIQI